MAVASKMVKPAHQDLLHLTVLRRERLSPHWMRVTLGGGDIDRFAPMGYDQWLRMFLPVGGEAGLGRIPAKANKALGYLKYLRIPEGVRPVMRNYTVRAFRPATHGRGAELDIDFVLHGSIEAGTAGPASAWAERCTAGETVAIIDEGLAFNPERGVDGVVLVADETGLPAVAGICASLPPSATGSAIIEVPDSKDALEFAHPAGVAIQWVARDDPHRTPGEHALDTLRRAILPDAGFHAYIVGERALPTRGRRYLVGERGVDKNLVSFCGYWRAGGDAVGRPIADREAA